MYRKWYLKEAYSKVIWKEKEIIGLKNAHLISKTEIFVIDIDLYFGNNFSIILKEKHIFFRENYVLHLQNSNKLFISIFEFAI